MNLKKPLIIVLFLFLLCSSSIVFGYYIGSSNLDMFGYPKMTQKLYRPHKPIGRDSFSMDTYRQEMTQYVEDGKNYIRAANNDIAEIEDCISSAKTEINAAINEFNDFVKYGY